MARRDWTKPMLDRGRSLCEGIQGAYGEAMEGETFFDDTEIGKMV
jgi:hypothetical protein